MIKKFKITNGINNNLLEIERARGFLEAAELKEDWIKEMQSSFLRRIIQPTLRALNLLSLRLKEFSQANL